MHDSKQFEHLEVLQQCFQLSKSKKQQLEILLVILNVRYDYSSSIAQPLLSRQYPL